ncbi:MAG: hypothetical protein A2015_06170 [Spirochaetes bacterium GWF1_31_7]|nr:MAG: hypothetical protein A2Y30_04855 [Spirochaetes bacterium GWE1_32_154]OHD46641.1 MAG: hypothetical protein A2015_06170 [Spirochaetes bacterium GWF1_31_7]OHD52606.1 MAG: hypothetical protein A2Y29_04740 [Spirochaetes bacterium GWE2_31_10]HBI36009.1 hypothetical protein [Spirochaetia bacterium]
MQIKEIILYNENGDTRAVKFELGKVNIITGESKTGKTAILDIIDYCLGSNNCNIKGEIIEEAVSWYGLIVQFENDQVFIGRQNPVKLSQKSTSNICFVYSNNITPPTYEELELNSTISALKDFLGNKLKIGSNLHVPENGTRDSLESNFNHSKLFCFQPQNTIAEYKYLFYSQDEPFIPQALKDTIPYFLGAVKEDDLKIRGIINSKKQELNKLKRKKIENDSIFSEGEKSFIDLVEEAIAVGLLSENIDTSNKDLVVNVFKTLKSSLINKANEEFVEESNVRLNELQNKKKVLRNEFDSICNDISATKDFESGASGYLRELKNQQARLLSLGLYKEPKDNNHWNSIMGAYQENLTIPLQAINKSLTELNKKLELTEIERPKITKYLNNLETKKEFIKSKISELNIAIKAINDTKEDAEQIKNINIRKGMVLGKVELYLKSLNTLTIDNSLERNICALEREISLLEDEISNEETEARLLSILNLINNQMTKWADKVSFEYQDSLLRLDVKKLTVFADMPHKSTPLKKMGSAENWLAVHLLSHLTLHKYFIENNRPVPNFIILDQPTQVHYPQKYL